jgi:hypothetical protein
MKTVLSFGMGVDSAAILLRWLDDPASRDFDLADLIVITAMTGDEFEQTRIDCETHILPRLRAAGVRFVQVARGNRQGMLAVLDDSRAPQAVLLEGWYKLSQEWEESGTIQATAGQRLCSIHAKGEILDKWLLQEFGNQPFRHVIGFECNETGRRDKDAAQTRATQPDKANRMPNRVPCYPLIDWAWDRQRCINYIASVTSAAWEKSCCGYCPFAGQNKAGRADFVRRFRREPDRAAQAIWLEHNALAFHDGMKLYKTTTVRQVCKDEGLTDGLKLFDEKLAAVSEWSVYRVGRVYNGAAVPPRSIVKEGTGSRAAMLSLLSTFGQVEVDEHDHHRVHLSHRPAPKRQGVEEYLVVAPAHVHEKTNKAFVNARARLAGLVVAA